MSESLFLNKRIDLTAETRLALFGGTFDPPHWGHLIIAEDIRDIFNLDYIVFVPAALPPHKLNKNIAGTEHRLNMLKKAVEPYPGFLITEIELKRPGPSYTIDTVNAFLEYGFGNLYLIVGADNARELHTWKDYREILRKVSVVIAERPGYNEPLTDANIVRDAVRVNTRLIEISSTEIREHVAAGRSFRLLVPGEVAEYISAYGLYPGTDED